MSDNADVTNTEINVQVQSSPKTPSKRKLTSTERALAESEELVKALGGSTEGGRKTRSSARGAQVTPPPPPPKKPRISTPRRGKKAKEEEAAAAAAAAEAVEEPANATEPEDITDAADQNASIIKNSTATDEPEKMVVDNGETEADAASTKHVVNDVAASAPTDEVDKAIVTNDVAPAVAAESSKVAEISATPTEILAPKPVEKSISTPAEPEKSEVTDVVEPETPNLPDSVAAVVPVIEAPVAIIPEPVEPVDVPAVAVTPEAPVAVPEPAPIATPVVVEETPAVAQPEPVSVEQPKTEVISKNGEIAPAIVISPVESTPITIDATTKLDIVTSQEPAIKPIEAIPEANAAV